MCTPGCWENRILSLFKGERGKRGGGSKEEWRAGSHLTRLYSKGRCSPMTPSSAAQVKSHGIEGVNPLKCLVKTGKHPNLRLYPSLLPISPPFSLPFWSSLLSVPPICMYLASEDVSKLPALRFQVIIYSCLVESSPKCYQNKFIIHKYIAQKK